MNVTFWFHCRMITLFKILKFLENFRYRYDSLHTHDNQLCVQFIHHDRRHCRNTIIIVNTIVGIMFKYCCCHRTDGHGPLTVRRVGNCFRWTTLRDSTQAWASVQATV